MTQNGYPLKRAWIAALVVLTAACALVASLWTNPLIASDVWTAVAPWLGGSVEVRAAWIQSVGTMSAATLAVWGAKSAVHSWKHDAPGRRALAVAEQCIVLAHQLEAESADLENWVQSICKNVRQMYARTEDDHQGLNLLVNQTSKVSNLHDELNVQCGIADIYFGLGLMKLVNQTRPYIGQLHLTAMFARSILIKGTSHDGVARMTIERLSKIADGTSTREKYTEAVRSIRDRLGPQLRLKA